MKPTDLRDGMRVLYAPVKGLPEKYGATVDGEPFKLGGHTWCVHLKDVDPTYTWAGGRVASAAVANLSKFTEPR